MRRLVGVVLLGALAVALLPAIARASLAPLAIAPSDLRTQLMFRVFGETSDFRASLAAAYGDRTSESPLRELALGVRKETIRQIVYAPSSAAPTFAQSERSALAAAGEYDLARTIRGRLLQAPRFMPEPSAPLADPGTAARSIPAAVFTVGNYQPVEPVPEISPEPGAVSFGPLALAAASTLPGSLRSTVLVPTTVQVGPVQFQGRVEGDSAQAPQIALHDSAYGAGANFDVRAGARKVNVDVSSSYERLTRNDASFSASALGSGSSWELPGADTPLVVPNYADMSKISVGAAVAFPVIKGLTLNLNYDAQRLLGGYGLPGVTNLDATDNAYGGKLIFAIPHSSSTLSISARQFRYQDNVLPANTFTQTREDVNFTVKF